MAEDVYREVIKDSKGAMLVNLYSEYGEKVIIKDSQEFKYRITKPLTQKKIFDLIVEVYTAENKEDDESAKEKILDQISNFEGIKIVVADDNSINQAVIMGLLENTKIDITLANNGDEVLDILSKENDIDMVLMDLNMPVMDGIEATKYIRANERYAHLPVVALTADQMDEDKLREYQMQAFIAKPVDFNKFYEVIIKILSNIKHEATTNNEYYMSKYGFNVKEGIARAGGNHHLYCKMVENFIKTVKESMETLLNKLLWGEFNITIRECDIIMAAADNVQAYDIYHLAQKLRDELEKEDTDSAKEVYNELNELIQSVENQMEKALLFERIYDKKAERYPRGSSQMFKEKMEKLSSAVSGRRPFHCAKLLEELDKYWWDVEREKIIEDLMEMSKEYKFDEMEAYIGQHRKIIDDA
jgi:CheY-like chemotaxis protein